MARKYIAFGSHNGDDFVKLGVIDASSREQARSKAREEWEGWTQYGLTPLRNWVQGKPKIETIVSWEDVIDGQLTVDDVLEEGDEDEDEGEEEEGEAKKPTSVSEAVRAGRAALEED